MSRLTAEEAAVIRAAVKWSLAVTMGEHCKCVERLDAAVAALLAARRKRRKK